MTFLPPLEVSCSFDLLIYTERDLAVPEKWEECRPQFMASSEQVGLRSFTTAVHKVSSSVSCKCVRGRGWNPTCIFPETNSTGCSCLAALTDFFFRWENLTLCFPELCTWFHFLVPVRLTFHRVGLLWCTLFKGKQQIRSPQPCDGSSFGGGTWRGKPCGIKLNAFLHQNFRSSSLTQSLGGYETAKEVWIFRIFVYF